MPSEYGEELERHARFIIRFARASPSSVPAEILCLAVQVWPGDAEHKADSFEEDFLIEWPQRKRTCTRALTRFENQVNTRKIRVPQDTGKGKAIDIEESEQHVTEYQDPLALSPVAGNTTGSKLTAHHQDSKPNQPRFPTTIAPITMTTNEPRAP